MQQAVITIYYTQFGKLNHWPQGKFYLLLNKPTFLADMTANKWIRNFSGYAISRQILRELPPKTQIIYRRRDLGTLYYARSADFEKYGILFNWGGHSQYCLPIKHWRETKRGKLPQEPKNLPELDIDEWKNKEKNVETLPFEQTKLFI